MTVVLLEVVKVGISTEGYSSKTLFVVAVVDNPCSSNFQQEEC